MNADEIKLIESQRQALLGQLRAAEAAVRTGLHTHGFGNTARAHMERAMAHIQEAYVAINELRAVRSVPQLVEDLNRIEQACNELRQQPPPGVTIKSFRP
ncbi:MAG: hypothetical protein ABSE97_03935 [Verrucomicrobiota bacterium]|jgi:hypothetical protein